MALIGNSDWNCISCHSAVMGIFEHLKFQQRVCCISVFTSFLSLPVKPDSFLKTSGTMVLLSCWSMILCSFLSLPWPEKIKWEELQCKPTNRGLPYEFNMRSETALEEEAVHTEKCLLT